MRRILALLTVVTFVLELGAAGGGAAVATQGAASGTQRATGATTLTLEKALHDWAGFPVIRTPRPLVLLQGYVLNPDSGFPDEATKDAFDNGAITPPASWPTGPAAAMGYPIVTPAIAFKTLITPTTNVLGTPPPLETLRAQLGSGLFLTDRGWEMLPAWLFSLSGVANPATVLAVAPSRIYSAPITRGGNSPSQLGVTVGRDDRHITVDFAGSAAGSGPCTANYVMAVEESAHAVALAVIAHPHDVGGTVACTAVGYPRHASAQLKAPLGDRVVVDAATDGAAPVTQASAGQKIG